MIDGENIDIEFTDEGHSNARGPRKGRRKEGRRARQKRRRRKLIKENASVVNAKRYFGNKRKKRRL